MGSLILLLVLDIMSQDKKAKKNDIEKLRMILDNPSDPKVRKIVDKHERNLESIRERLSDKPSKTEMKHTTSDFLRKSDSLEPRVVIHQKEEMKSIPSEIVPPEPKSYKTEQHREEYADEDDFQGLFDDEDLYEVEKVDVSEPEFLQVKPKEMEKIFEKTTKETEGTLPIPILKEKEPMVKVHEKDEKLPEWEPVEEAKSEEVGAVVKEKEEPTTKEFTEVTTIDEKVKTQKPLDEKKEEIPTWDPIELEKTKEEKEMPSEFVEEKPADATFEEVTEKKVEEPATAVKETKAELKRKERELKKKRKEEQKLKKLEGKKVKRAEKKNEKNLRMKEYEQKQREKEEQKLKNLEETEEKRQIDGLVADGEKGKEIDERSEIKGQKIEEKKAKKEKEAKIKSQLKKNKLLAASERMEITSKFTCFPILRSTPETPAIIPFLN